MCYTPMDLFLMILQNIKIQKIHIDQFMIISKVNIMSWKDTNLDTIQILLIKKCPNLTTNSA